jgi:hypothetical protein
MEQLMVALFAVLIWTLLLWFLVGLCHAARVGDGQGRPQDLTSPAHEPEQAEATAAAASGQEPAPERVALAA